MGIVTGVVLFLHAMLSSPINGKCRVVAEKSIPVLLTAVAACAQSGTTQRVFQANGIKIGEVSADSAIVWTRLTQRPERHVDGVPFPATNWIRDAETEKRRYDKPQLPAGKALDEMADSVPGQCGEVRVVYWPKNDPRMRGSTPWRAVDRERDFTRQFQLSDLRPGSTYHVVVESRSSARGPAGQTVEGRFKTAPAADQRAQVTFTVVTGQDFHRRDDPANGHRIYRTMLSLKPDFFVHTGDIVYYDKPRPVAASPALARLKWNRMYALPLQREFHNSVASYFIKDDHDTWQNDCWPGMQNARMGTLTFVQGQAIFLEQVPMGARTYRTFRWGRDLQVWLVEGRDFRSPNNMPDGVEKTIWGAEQMAWFRQTVQASDATFRVLISPTPIVGPDRTRGKHDNHANVAFAHEGRSLRRFIGAQRDMIVICGDRHWQYASIDPETQLREYGCGPTSDKHAGGFKLENRSPMHRFLAIKGGFLSVSVGREAGEATMTLRHHAVDGGVRFEDRLRACGTP